jgi:iron only hydrogenase large subunit-like protein
VNRIFSVYKIILKRMYSFRKESNNKEMIETSIGKEIQISKEWAETYFITGFIFLKRGNLWSA